MSRIIDACCTINLYAAGNLLTLLPALGGEWYVQERVVTETRYIRRADPDDESKLIREPIDLRPALDAGVLRSCTATEDELALFVELAVPLGDGEAMCLAIAQSRGWTLATDDRKARRIATERGVSVLSTPQLLRQWAEATTAEDKDVTRVLNNIQTFANFRPNRRLPDADWWEEIVKKLAS
jgi:predicted nucleic acid-binding protein